MLRAFDMPLDLAPFLRFTATNIFFLENKDHQLGWSKIEIKAKVDSLLANLQPFLVDEKTIRDAFIEQELQRDTRPVHLCEDGKRRHPLTPSLDAFTAVFPGADGRTAYHHEDNIVPCCDAVNRIMRHYEKPLLRAMSTMVLATGDDSIDRRLYERALLLWRDCLKNSYEMGTFSEVKHNQRINKPLPANMPAIMEALRSGKPLLPRTTKPSTVFRMTKKGLVENPPLNWKFPDHGYIMKNIFSAAGEYGLDNEELRRLWLRNDTFCPFALDSVLPDDYNDGTVWDIFYAKFQLMRNHCDWREKDNPHRESAEIGELMIAVAHLWFQNIRRDLHHGVPIDRCGRDELGLIPHPTIRWLLSCSVGHRHHSAAMTLGISNWDPAGGILCSFDYDKCNICWETCACNYVKFCYNEKYYPVIFGLLQKVRKQSLAGIAPSFHLAELPNRELETEYLPTLEIVELGDEGPEEYVDVIDIEPAFVAVHEDESYQIDSSALDTHSELLIDVNAEDIGFVPGYTDLRDYGLDGSDQQQILDEIADAPAAQGLDVEAFQALTDEATAHIDPEAPGSSGFARVLNILRQYYKTDGSYEYARIANSLLQHLGMHQHTMLQSAHGTSFWTLFQRPCHPQS
ncbi:hypothetical protein PV05_05739 [Exophiala xenobiotica]|uniref:Uncharacterized protein n=1 Tax=Exophiala xenobiotica TaxID=348802 RepID=A0A0D2D460_9EURO|nr:uncharacterized protein PV05_05739 [Exophiala xenobiotica]KIW57147.1 hypothetical protein PV05_05739 [Exophiala xenobiotica]